MNAPTHVLAVALGALLFAPAHAADGIAALFSDVAPKRSPTVTKLDAPEIIRPRLPLSARMRTALDERAAPAANSLPLAVRKPTRTWTLDHGDAILMDSVVVNAPPEKKVEIERTPNSLVHAFTSGDLWASKSGSPGLYWALGHVREPSLGTASTAPRVELRLMWSW
jgi:hypothetical protein